MTSPYQSSEQSENLTPAEAERQTKLRFLLDQVSFDTSDWQFDGEDIQQRVHYWLTPQSDTVSLNFFSRPPDLPTTRNLDDFNQYTSGLLAEAKGRLVEQEICILNGFNAMRQIVKIPIPNRDHGLIYLGSWTIAFANLSYVVKVQCIEHGTTGMRESLLFAQNRAGSASRRFEGEQLIMPDWNPDAPEFDAEFPAHPISRVRPIMARLQSSLQISPALQNCEPFPLPSPTQ